MEKQAIDDKFVYMSIRLPLQLRTELQTESKKKLIALNSLVNQVLTRHSTHGRMMEHIGSVELGRQLFARMIETIDSQTMEGIGRDLGSKRVKETFAFFDIRPNMSNLISYHFEQIAAYAGWYRLNSVQTEEERKLILEHDFGRRWSAFLKGFYAELMISMLRVAPNIDIQDGLVIINY